MAGGVVVWVKTYSARRLGCALWTRLILYRWCCIQSQPLRERVGKRLNILDIARMAQIQSNPVVMPS